MQPFRRRRSRRLLAAIACLAFVLQGFVPSIAQAVASMARSQLYPGELCSADLHGARLRLADAIAAEAPASERSLPKAAHCPFCSLPAGSDLPIPNAETWDFPLAPVEDVLPAVSLDEPATPPAQWRPHTPRAPPRC